MPRLLLSMLAVAALLGCEQATEPAEPALVEIASFDPSGNQVVHRASGGGRALLGTLELKFNINAHLHGDGSASGWARHFIDDPDFTYDFVTDVTCLAVDPVLGRAWVGGVIRSNNTTDPAFQQAIHQPGRDIWFRVADGGEGASADARITFVGFEGSAGINTSEQYCAMRIWPNNASPVIQGNIQVK